MKDVSMSMSMSMSMHMQDVTHISENSSVALLVILKLGGTSDPVIDQR
jgi:hypothetical protein